MPFAPRSAFRFAGLAVLLALIAPSASWSADPKPGPTLTIKRVTAPIVIDGDLSDPGWQGVEPITTWFETNVGDNVEPQVKNVGYLAYDDQYFYAGFNFEDPHPGTVRAPLGDHDAVPGSTDYAGVIVDSHKDGKTAQMFLANPGGVQYDAVTSDATGEDSSPDFFWDATGRITATGWTLEIRIPFSSLRYSNQAEPTWGILLYRNYPRDRRYQFFSARLPRDVNCFICNSSKLVGLANLPHGSHLVAAPFTTAQQNGAPANGLGTPLELDSKAQAGLDLKWSPISNAAIDGTVNPDFSQVESDAAQIVANERFALFFPEKRPFFLEGIDLLATPIQAVYTRTVTSPRMGLRTTGKLGSTAYTALVTHDRGGGLAILPGPQGSDFALQDFQSDVGIVRLRHDLGHSFVSVLATGREIQHGGHNLVVGPDFQWRPRASDAFTGQALWSQSKTPDRTDLAPEWDGRELSDHAMQLSWSHNTQHVDGYAQGQDFGRDFRPDEGFVPQVGYREIYGETGYTIRPKDTFFSRVRMFTVDWYDAQPDGKSLFERVSVGAGMDGRWNSFLRVELNRDQTRVGDEWLERFRPRLLIQASPGRVVNSLILDSYFGQEIDFANAREGTGATINGTLVVRPDDHLELRGNAGVRWLDVHLPSGGSARLFTAQVSRLRTTYAFSSRAFVRLIGQYVQTTYDPALYAPGAVDRKQADFSSSALFAYKLNWQTVVYAGYGDVRTFDPAVERLQSNGMQIFAKLSYALQL
jgi:hypothetical protein